jgi:hypothetical protein
MQLIDPAVITLTGTPVGSFEFTGLPSVNTHYGKHFRPRGIATAEWRYEAKYKGIEAMGWDTATLIKRRALVVVRVYPPFEEISDIHNVYIKGILDGFTDAGIWVDDEWAWLPLVWYMWAGIGTHTPGRIKTRRTVIDVYELEKLIINGDKHRLPKGRKRNA